MRFKHLLSVLMHVSYTTLQTCNFRFLPQNLKIFEMFFFFVKVHDDFDYLSLQTLRREVNSSNESTVLLTTIRLVLFRFFILFFVVFFLPCL